MQDYDDTTAFLGQWGRFQQVVFFLLCASIVPNGFGAFSVVFLTDIPGHHCLVPEVNLTQDWRNATIPREVVDGKREPSRCSRYRLDVVRNLSAQGLIPGRDVNLTDLEQEGCVDGWIYSKDIYQSTIVSEVRVYTDNSPTVCIQLFPVFCSGRKCLIDFLLTKGSRFFFFVHAWIYQFDLVCSDHWKQPFTSSLYFLGVLVGSFFSGQLSDGFGRKPVFFATMAVQTIFTFVQMFSPSWTVFSILLFISGLGQISNYVSAFVLGSEILTGNVRVLFSSLGVCLCFAFGYMMLPLFAYFLRDWKSLILCISLPGLLYIPLWWFTLSIGYFGLSLNTSRLHANPYLSCFISAAVEVPAYISSWLALRYLPRRLSVICILLLGGVSLYLIQLVPESLPDLSVALEMLGKFGLTTGTSLMFAYTAELYPTVLRNTATGTCTMVSRVGSSIAPFLLQLSEYFKYLPYILLGTLAVVSAFAALFLPESFGRPLPQTIQQMQKRESMKCPFITRREHSKPAVLFESRL
ncbi:solute carrier family 22 member 4-like isoform X5 [Sebastes fasciatus]|uniref:solute carrier family 22 member 4-like isoform X5 n=1 Tax=Sebastes fasciatus TaxID=394691 RepID=UPI003D9EE041